MPYYLLIPFCAAFLYATASLLVKRSLREGARVDQTFLLSNLCITLVFGPLYFLGSGSFPLGEIWKPVAAAALFFAGNFFTFLSIQKGDVSLVTPLMGTKVVLVGLSAILLTRQHLTSLLWIAAALTTAGIFVMGFSEFRRKLGPDSLLPIAMALSSAAFFSVQDALIARWAPSFGAPRFLAIEMVALAAFSSLSWLFQGRPVLKFSRRAFCFALGGSVLIGFQALLVAFSLARFNDATGVNVVYASRGLWALAIVAWLGASFGNDERASSGSAFRWRVAGTVLVTAAIVITIVDRARHAH